MGEQRDGWGKAEVIIGALGALGSIAIPVMLFVVGNQIAERQAADSERQLQADRVERMLGHLASTNADERRLAVSVVRYFSTTEAFPDDLIPILIEVAAADPKEDVAATASLALERVSEGRGSAAAAAKSGLTKLPKRLNVSGRSDDSRAAAATATAAQNNVMVMQQQAPSPAELQKPTELRYYRKEDQVQAQEIAGQLERQGIKANVVDLSAKKEGHARPKNFDLVLGKD